jgi:hypothetical protein
MTDPINPRSDGLLAVISPTEGSERRLTAHRHDITGAIARATPEARASTVCVRCIRPSTSGLSSAGVSGRPERGEVIMGLLSSLTFRGGNAAAARILGVEGRRTRQLNRLAHRVDALLAAPYQTGLEHVTILNRPDFHPSRTAWHLSEAEQCFATAFGNFKNVDPLQSAWAAVQLAIISVATGRRGNALHWTQRGLEQATRAREQIRRQIPDKADGRVGRMRLASEGSTGRVAIGGTATTGLVAAAAGVTIVSGVGLVAVGAALGANLAYQKGVDHSRHRQVNAGRAREQEIADFIDELIHLRAALGDRSVVRAAGRQADRPMR